jgi:hypothetical protein
VDHASGGNIVLEVGGVEKRRRDAGEGILTTPSLITSVGFIIRAGVEGGLWSGQGRES